jgi:ferrous iron transport protein B
MTFPRLPETHLHTFDTQRQAALAAANSERDDGAEDPVAENIRSARSIQMQADLAIVDAAQSEAALRYSLAGRIGTRIESVTHWAGFDWRTNIALLGGFAAKEVIVSTLGTAYSLGAIEADAAESLSDRLTAEPGWTTLTAWSMIIFVMFYAPCFITVVCISRESSWRWGLFSMVFNTALAFSLAVIIYQAGVALGY